ncbi:MAG: imidazole glycerol phosphate synthase subunit HisH [Thermodesulfobacteriota bacterium]
MIITIIDYDAGNLPSVVRALSFLGYKSRVTSDPEKIETADRIIFPGVGAAGSAMKSLKKHGLDLAVKKAFIRGIPILGICLGTQVIMEYSEENDTNCIGIVKGCVRAFPSNIFSTDGRRLKIPHMGWNGLKLNRFHPVFSEIKETDEFYFVHGFYPDPEDTEQVIGVTEYGDVFTSVLGLKNLIATQFHPEKSGKPGLSVLRQFGIWNPESSHAR